MHKRSLKCRSEIRSVSSEREKKSPVALRIDRFLPPARKLASRHPFFARLHAHGQFPSIPHPTTSIPPSLWCPSARQPIHFMPKGISTSSSSSFLSPSLIFIHDTWVVFSVFVGGGVARASAINHGLSGSGGKRAGGGGGGGRAGGKGGGGGGALGRSLARSFASDLNCAVGEQISERKEERPRRRESDCSIRIRSAELVSRRWGGRVRRRLPLDIG